MNIFSWFKKPTQGSEVPRAPRVLLPFFPLHFIADDDKDLLVANISTSGVGFQKTSFPTLPEDGSRITGTLRLEDKSYPLSLKVMHVSSSIVGCLIDPPSPDYSRDLSAYLEVELSAVQAREVDQSLLKETPEGKAHWFVGRANSCELFLVENGGRLKNFHCTIWGHYFESKHEGHQRFGAISRSGQTDRSNIYPQSELIEDVEDSEQLAAMVLRFISNIPSLPASLRTQLVERVKS
jgi:hypothetical protein